jgi:uncharacterized RDD family membrane protein YckC
MSTGVEQTGAAPPRARAQAGRAAEGLAAPVVVRARQRAVRAPFALRCGALLIDYTLVVSVVAFSTLLARVLGDGARASSDFVIALGYVAAGALAVLDLFVLPVLTGRTAGKWATGLRVERAGGGRLSFSRALLRHSVGYLLSLITLGTGFLVAAFHREGRALHDLIAGTVVVRE